MGGGVDAEHGGSWRPAARAFGVGREASHVSALILPLRAWLGNPSAPDVIVATGAGRRSAQVAKAATNAPSINSDSSRASALGFRKPAALASSSRRARMAVFCAKAAIEAG